MAEADGRSMSSRAPAADPEDRPEALQALLDRFSLTQGPARLAPPHEHGSLRERFLPRHGANARLLERVRRLQRLHRGPRRSRD